MISTITVSWETYTDAVISYGSTSYIKSSYSSNVDLSELAGVANNSSLVIEVTYSSENFSWSQFTMNSEAGWMQANLSTVNNVATITTETVQTAVASQSGKTIDDFMNSSWHQMGIQGSCVVTGVTYTYDDASGETETDPSAKWKLAFQGYTASNGGWAGVESVQGEMELSSTIGELMEKNSINNVDNLGGFDFQIWNCAADEDNGVTVHYTLTVTRSITGDIINDEKTVTIGEDSYKINDYNSVMLAQYNTTNYTYTGTYEFEENDAIVATLEVVSTPDAIADIKSDVEAVEVARYNLLGQKISGEQKGINIIVYSDGSSKKVLVK